MAYLQRLKKLGTILATFAVALLIGYVMQYGDADASRFADPSWSDERVMLPAQLDTSPLERATELAPKVLAPVQLNASAVDTVRVDAGSVKLTALVAEAARSARDADGALSEEIKEDSAFDCRVDLEAAPGAEATVVLSLFSGCRTDQPFEVHHNGLVISGLTDGLGQASISVPALTTNASLFVSFPDGVGAAASAVVPDAEDFNRVVLQWEGKDAEFIQFTQLEAATEGQLTRLGAATGQIDRFAEVYSFPSASRMSDGLSNLTVQAEVSDATCGQQFNAQSFLVKPDAEPNFKDIRITLPGCEHAGTFLELKKVLGGQTLLQE